MNLNNYCRFGNGRAYVLMAIARKKENPLTGGEEIVFREVARDEETLERKAQKLRTLAREYTEPDSDDSLMFRLYVTVNARDTENAYFAFKRRMDDWITQAWTGDQHATEKFKRIDSYWKSELQKPEHRDEKLLLWDIDEKPVNLDEVEESLREHTRIHVIQETPNGFHIVTEPFNYTEYVAPCRYELKNDGLLFVEAWE